MCNVESDNFRLVTIRRMSERFSYALWERLSGGFLVTEMCRCNNRDVDINLVYSYKSLSDAEAMMNEIFSGLTECKLCGLKFAIVTHSHLRAYHNVSVEQYKEMFPDFPLMSHEYRVNLSEHNLRLGKSPPKMFGNRHASYQHSEGHKESVRKTMLYKWANDAEYRQKCSEGNSRAKIEAWKDPEYARKMFLAWQRKPNNAEIRLAGILDKYFPGEFEYCGDGSVIMGGQNPDFVNVNGKKLLIELNGCYWHACEKCGFGDVTLPNGMDVEQIHFDDAKKIGIFSSYGFKTVVIWEHELEEENLLAMKVGGKDNS